ncbi:amidase [Bradyrhizobium brasilense]|uniref:amidase n=1 Tax=Bradyrhizobium brasilense TaxID=1419277 RepID=UPI0024B251FF|nr:amidase [Bradyrhizobium australafricanum]WFU35022.1 amidase [Bradyrhizobium australafricanum]
MSQTQVHSGGNDALARLDAIAQADLVRSGEISASELVEAAIARIETTNPALNAVTHKLYAQARERAASPALSGPFAGVPFLIKDVLSVAGTPNTFGCRALADFVPPTSSPYALALQAVGLVTVGRTNTPEFALIDATEPKLFGPTHNPWDLARSPGGSSGGAGAAVAAGMTPIAHASDGGGSIRHPACHNGVFGLKPSRGRNRSDGAPPMPFDLPDVAVNHVLTRSVRDSALMLSLTEDPDTKLGPLGFVRDPVSKPLRIGLIREGFSGNGAATDVDDALVSTSRLCESLGHHVEPTKWPFPGQAAIEAFLDAWMVLAASAVQGICAWIGCDADRENFEPWTLGLAGRGAALLPDRIAGAVAQLTQASRALDAFFETYDVLLSPVARHPPKLLGEHATDLPFDILFERVVDNSDFTPLINAAGIPAMSIPLYWSANNLPIGSHFAARAGAEATLFSLAYQLEAARPWADHWAPASYPAERRAG